jgi:hypothetical protein
MSFQCLFNIYLKPLIPIIAAAVAVLIGSYLAKRAYFNQKEYEWITERYLRDGLDRISAQVEKSLAIFRHNYAQALTVLKLFRDTGADIPEELYKTGFIDPETGMFEFWPDYRIRDLIGDDIIHQARELLDAFVRNSYAFIKGDLCTAVSRTVEPGKTMTITSTPQTISQLYFSELEKTNKESYRYYEILPVLHDFANILQADRFSLKTLKEFHNKTIVKQRVNMLRQIFSDEIQQYKPEDKEYSFTTA